MQIVYRNIKYACMSVPALFFYQSPLRAQQVYLAPGHQVNINNEVIIPGGLTNGAAVVIGNGGLHFSGNTYRNLSGASYGGSGYVTFTAPASGTQSLEGGNVSFGKLRVSNAGNVLLSGGNDAGINDTLDLADGRLELGNQNLNLGSNGVIAGYAAGRYVITNGSGYISYDNVAAGKRIFCPVGVSGGTDYTPALVKNGTAAQTIYMRVQRVPGAGAQPDTVTGIRRVWNIWTAAGGALDTLVLYHNDSLGGSQYDPSEATVIRYDGSSWQKRCPFAAELLSGGLRALPANDRLLLNTAASATGDAYYSKSSDMELPAVALNTSDLSACAGTGSAAVPYGGVTGGADQYSISWGSAALAAGFTDVIRNVLPADTIRVLVPASAAPGVYTGTLTVRSSNTECVSTTYNINMTVHPLPQPVVHWDGEQLSTDSIYTEYRWYRGSQEIQGATDATCRPVVDGSYAVYVTDSNGCSGMSSYVQADHVGIASGEQPGRSVRIYPNPSSGIIHIAAPVPVDIQIRSMDGRLLYEQPDASSADIAWLPAGVYLMHVREHGTGILMKTEQVSKY